MTKSKKIVVQPADLNAATITTTDEKGNIVRKTLRSQEQKQVLRARLNRVMGQIRGIANMIEEDKYCEDVLIQLTSCYKSILSIIDILLCDHLVACDKEGMEKGKYDLLEEAMRIFKRYQ